MTRACVLLLPLACIWLVLDHHSASPEHPPLSPTVRAPSSPRSFTGRAIPSPQDRVKPRGSRSPAFAYHILPLPSEDTPSIAESPSLPERMERSPRFTQAWSHIPSKALQSLSPSQQDNLASYLDSLLQEDPQHKHWLCWGPQTAPEVVIAYHEVEKAVTLIQDDVQINARQFLGRGKWNFVASNSSSNREQGLPVTVTWSITPDGTATPGGNGASSSPSNFRSWLRGLYGGTTNGSPESQPWFPIISAAIQTMGDQCGITFVYEPNDDGASISSFNSGILGIRGDIRISARSLDGTGGVLAFAYAPDWGDIVFDSSDGFFNSTSQNSIRLHNVMAHELGHAIGLAHVCPLNQSKLMEPSVTLSFRGPQFDETYSLQRQYGDPLERNSIGRHNDNTGRATRLTFTHDTLFTRRWLSIDDNSDLDYYIFSARRGQRINVSINPTQPAYLEGSETESCNNGTTFDPARQQNLTLELLDRNGSTVLASSTSAPSGSTEQIEDFLLEEDGDYYFRINGDSANSAQLYTLTALLEGAPPAPEIALISSDIVAESGEVKNGRPDPGETIDIALEIQNIGNLTTQNLQATISPPPGVTMFTPTTVSLPEAEPGESVTTRILLALSGECGQVFSIPYTISDDFGNPISAELTYQLGELVDLPPFTENFDENMSLPEGWSIATADAGIPWSVVDSESSNGNNSIFSPGVFGRSSATLTSPEVVLANSQNVLSFFHFYDIETNWDGGVLEASLDNGAWFDLPTHPDVTLETGGYSQIIVGAANSEIAGRMSWSGNSFDFVQTQMILPNSWANQAIRLRWILAHDDQFEEQGWFIDDISLHRRNGLCESHRPMLSLSSSSETLNEGNPEQTITFTITSELPLLEDLIIHLNTSGTAEPSDTDTPLQVTLPSGQTSVTFTISATTDDEIEGEETLIIALPTDDPNFAATEDTSQSLTINDSASFSIWASAFFTETVQPSFDSDHDGWSNLAEYLLGTDPSAPSSTPQLSLLLEGDVINLPLGALPSRPDASLGVEVSANLQTWETAPVTVTANGLQIPRDPMKRYLRLTFSLSE